MQIPSLFALRKAIVFFASVLALTSAALAQSKEKVIHTFHVKNGEGPEAAPVLDAAGNLYGTTFVGGSYGCEGDGCGTVYELIPESGNGCVEKVLHVFHFDGKDGVFVGARLIFDQAGNLYGTTTSGGDGCSGYGCGTVFELSPNSDGTWTEKILHSFALSDGSIPYTAVLFDSAGNIYGTTYGGGNHNAGVVYRLSAGKDGDWIETVLHDFTGGKDGGQPGQLISDHAGNLYSVTGSGGAYGLGAVFQLSPQAGGKWKYTLLYSSKPNKSDQFAGSIALDNSGAFYGTLVSQETYGAIFHLSKTKDRWKENIIFTFNSLNNGARPLPHLAFDAAGDIFGTTEYGGRNDLGVVYRLTKINGVWKERVLHDFAGGKDGLNPWDGVILDPSGSLFGTTFLGGTPGHGVVFQVTP